MPPDATADQAPHATTVAGTVYEVAVGDTATGSEAFEILNRGDVDLYFTVDGSAPTVAGADTYVVPPGQSRLKRVDTAQRATVKLISAQACAFSVTKVGDA
jgi:hypothetical protein